MKPPMVCKSCGRSYHIHADETRCVCGQHLFRVTLTPDGRLQGPPSMPEHVRALMEQRWREQQSVRLDTDTYRRFPPHEINHRGDEHFHAYGGGFSDFTPMQPQDVSRDASAAFGRASENVSREEFYASWSAYDAALEVMGEQQRILQQRAEVMELERMVRL